MGRGRSGAGKSSGGGGNASTPKAKTPSGVDYDGFMKMSDSQKYATMDSIIHDSNIKVPDYLDGSVTSKVMYGLGLTNKPTVVDDATLASMPGKDLYRTVYEQGSMPPPSSADILDQIRTGDFTQLSGSGGSAYGRALYFARDDFTGSRCYGDGERNAMMMRAKINPKANMRSEQSLTQQMRADSAWQNHNVSANNRDSIALYALSHGIDGWYSGTYTMIVNRGILTASSKNKSIATNGLTKTGQLKKGSSYAYSWDTAMDLN